MVNQAIATERKPASISNDSADSAVLSQVRQALHGLRYGEIAIVVQDGVVIRVERTEKVRVYRSS